MTATTVEDVELSPTEEDAYSLTEAAIFLDQARQSESRGQAMAQALNHNLDLWVLIRTLAQRDDSPLPLPVRSNLIRLSGFVAETTFRHGVSMSDENIDTLININLQISEGLLEGQARARHAAE